MTNNNDNSLVTKAVAGVTGLLATVFMLGLTAVPAQAQQASSNVELRAQIQSLLDTISGLEAQVNGNDSGNNNNSGNNMGDPYDNCSSSVWLRDLSQGTRGQDVMALQQFLNMSASTRVAASGPGSPGNETMYYGALTAQAVTNFQETYRADVLAPLSLSAGTGYWGASSRAKARMLCEMNDPVVEEPEEDEDDDIVDPETDDNVNEDDNDELDGGEASLEDYDISSGDDDDIQEGGEGEVADIEFDVEDGDVRVGRVDLSFDGEGNVEDEPWEVFEEVMLMVDGDEVASADLDDEDDWLDNDDAPYRFRLSNLNQIVREGDTAEMTVALSVQNGVDGVESGNESWEIYVAGEEGSNTGGIRAVDGEGIQNYIGDDNDRVTFDIEEEGEGEELSVSESSDNPDASTIQVDEDDESPWYDILVADFDSEDGSLELNEVPVTFFVYGDGTGTDGTDGTSQVSESTGLDSIPDGAVYTVEIDGTEVANYTDDADSGSDEAVNAITDQINASEADVTAEADTSNDVVTVTGNDDQSFEITGTSADDGEFGFTNSTEAEGGTDGTPDNFGDFDEIVSDMELLVDGDAYDDYDVSRESDLDDEAPSSDDAQAYVVTFDLDDDDVMIDEGDTEVALSVEFGAIGDDDDNLNYDQGQRVAASFLEENVQAIDAEGADDLDSDDLEGSANGEVHRLLSAGIFTDNASTDADSSNNDNSENFGTFTFRFDVEAFEEDFFIERRPSSDTDEGDDDERFEYTVDGPDSDSVDSTNLRIPGADRVTRNGTTYYRINEGESEQVRFTVSLTPDAGDGGLYSVLLEQLEYVDEDGNNFFYELTPEEDYETDAVRVNGN